jgi:hypothetical protein
MALFKILKGDSSRISTDVTPFHDGYAYFTPDDGGFYIDSEDNGEQKRHRINPVNSGGSTAVSATLLSGGWSSGEQTLQISGVTAESNGVIGLSQSVSDAEMEAAKNAELYVCGQGAGTITIAAYGETPTRDIPVVVILLG